MVTLPAAVVELVAEGAVLLDEDFRFFLRESIMCATARTVKTLDRRKRGGDGRWSVHCLKTRLAEEEQSMKWNGITASHSSQMEKSGAGGKTPTEGYCRGVEVSSLGGNASITDKSADWEYAPEVPTGSVEGGSTPITMVEITGSMTVIHFHSEMARRNPHFFNPHLDWFGHVTHADDPVMVRFLQDRFSTVASRALLDIRYIVFQHEIGPR